MSSDNSDTEALSSVPLGKRLEAMEPEDVTDIMKEMRWKKKEKKMPKTGSMEVLLTQYLTTNDYYQIDNVLMMRDQHVVEKTIERLEVRCIFPLLDILVMKLEANPRKGSTLLIWVKALFHYHSTFMMSVPELSRRVSFLKKLLENRAASYKKLLKLRGRLDLVLTHARSVSSQDADFSQASTPLVEVDEDAITAINSDDDMEEEGGEFYDDDRTSEEDSVEDGEEDEDEDEDEEEDDSEEEEEDD